MSSSLFLSVVAASRFAAQAEPPVNGMVNVVVDDGAPPGAGVARWQR